MRRDPVHRRIHHHQMTFGLHYAFSGNCVLPLSHDEVVHGKGSLLAKMPGGEAERFANLRAYFAFMWGHPGRSCCSWGRSSPSPASGTTTAVSTGTCWTIAATPACAHWYATSTSPTAPARPPPRPPATPRAPTGT